MFYKNFEQIVEEARLIGLPLREYFNAVITAVPYSYEFFLPTKKEGKKLLHALPDIIYYGKTPCYPLIYLEKWSDKPRKLWIVKVLHKISAERAKELAAKE